ncbi:LuxR family transcriptional regulator [uncultured Sulfitobacter sp.]|uniref:helix-turn-helix transcriptional regulator n=1 Tax=uncultured Sulfitobacter sp. TaxID=191468 RepID=UPI002628232E|nr:LuxR family transcriptional regulator [uncultured Sulfitobacter sp.]
MFIKHAANLEKCATVDTLWDGACTVFASLGFHQAVYLSVDSAFESLFVRSTMPDLYRETPPKEDPFLIHACNRYEILKIGVEFMAQHPYISDSERAFITRAADHGLRAGIAMPMRLKGAERFGGFVIGNAMDGPQFLRTMMPRAEDMRMFCMVIHRRIEELIATAPASNQQPERRALIPNALPEPFDVLTPRETEVLLHLAQGRTRKATAHLFGLSVHTVSDYAKIGYRKLGVRNRAEVAALLYGGSRVKGAGP